MIALKERYQTLCDFIDHVYVRVPYVRLEDEFPRVQLGDGCFNGAEDNEELIACVDLGREATTD